MEPSRKLLQIVRGAMLFSILLYAFVGEQVRHTPGAPPDRNFYFALTLVAIITVGMVFAIRRTFILRAEATLAAQPEDAAALGRWRTGYIITFVLCETVALYGLVLRFLGFTLSDVAPFYVAGFALMLMLGPRRPAA
jgi:F0F1-type ATP synthase membrane subunit c/vacuolar-type H+-ATPase subunit K